MKLTSAIGIISLGLGMSMGSAACSASGGGDGDGDTGGDGDTQTVTRTLIDEDGDGVPDGLDTNGDGVIDIRGVGIDEDGDGVYDGIDTNGDGIIDEPVVIEVPITGDGDGDIAIPIGDGDGDGGDGDDGDPDTCAAAASNRTYVGCEFWPTITYNPLYTDFDFAVVLANGGTEDATVTVSGGGLTADITDTVPAGGLKAIALPWVAGLKGPEFSRTNTSGGRATESVRADGGAYKVTTSVPVTAWQFNPLQFKKDGVANCQGSSFNTASCFSVSNDASLLVPAAAMTRNYRVFSRSGEFGGEWGDSAGGVAITATQDGTTVDVQLGPNCAHGVNDPVNQTGTCIAPGTGIAAASAGDVVTYELNAGDVIQLLGESGPGFELAHADLSGSVVQSSAPVQVIGFTPITNMPDPTVGNADHLEELVLPAEVIGNEYLVAPPSNPGGVIKGGHMVRIYGNVDGTNLTYDGTAPAGAPASISAGDSVEIGPITAGFRVMGDQPFAVGSFMLGGYSQSPEAESTCRDMGAGNYPCSGDPAFSMMVSPEQFRSNYTFLAPNDYDANFADVLIPEGATVTIDGAPVSGSEAVAPGWTVARVPLAATGDGSHRLEADMNVGLQVMGFGHATSYYYPGGLNLELISEPPPPVVVR